MASLFKRKSKIEKAEKKYKKIVDLSIKDKIYIEFINKFKENESSGDQQEVKESLSFDAFGETWTFTSTQAIREAANQPKRFAGIQNRDWINGINKLTTDDISLLFANDKLAPAPAPIEITDDLVPWLSSLLKLNPNVNWTFFDRELGESSKYLYTFDELEGGSLQGRYLIDRQTDQYTPPGSTAVSFNEKFGTSPATKRVTLSTFIGAINKLIQDRFPFDILGDPDFKELVKEVAEQLQADLAAEQATRTVINATLARDVPELEDVVEPLEKPEKPKLTPFDFQCYLLENISKLVDQRGNANYKHVIPVTTDGDPGSIINTIQHGGKTGAVKELLNICPEVYALLVPYLKISRLDYDKFGNVATDGNGRAIMSDLEIPNFLTQDDISDILSGRAGRATGAGIKSFSWSLDGVQPAEVDNNIKATLVMYFQSVNDFFNGASSAGQQTPNFLDLIINSPAVKKLTEKEGEDPEVKSCPDDLIKPELHKGYEGRNYRVKICAGWAVPDKETILELVKDDSKAENLVEAIADSRISLFLQMTQHQISFNQNGSLELTVDYQASLAGLLSGRTADIFDETPKLIKENIKGQEEIIDNIDDIDESNLTDSNKEKKKAALEEIKKIKNKDKNVKYKKLLKNIYSADAIRFISLNPNELSMTPYKDLTPKQRQKRVKRRNDETLEILNVGTINQELIDAIGKDESRDAGEVAKAYSEVATKSFEEMMKQDKIAIPFFYLGDLLDAVIEEIKINNSNNTSDGLKPLNFNFFISDVEMIDPLLAFKAKNLEDLINCGYNLREIEFIESASKETPTKNAELNGIYKTMNIGDIPISLDAFQLWFKNNVVKKGRENYFFLYFVKDVCKEMISRALSSKCFGKEFNFEQRFDTQPLTLAKQETKISNFTPNVLTTAQKISNAKASISCDLDPTQTELGLLLYPTDSNPKDLRGDYTKDVGRGIYHHYLGSSCGLVKTINFNRQDQPYLRESRIQKEGALGAEQLRELYSANIDLVGNTLYRNGMYIYINPSLIGASQEYLDYLGLHGYYLVTAVKSTVTPSSFDVSIEALHEGIEFKGNKLQPSAFDTGDFEGLDPERGPENIVQREIEDLRLLPRQLRLQHA